MIFVTLGSQMFQFNRLLEALDRLKKEGKIEDELFAQIGYSDYKPSNFEFKEFLNREEYKEIMDKSSIVIAHGGTGAIVGALKQGKKVIAVPRLAKYGEHVDDHQFQMVRRFCEMGYIYECDDCDSIDKAIEETKSKEFTEYISNTGRIIDSIDKYISQL